MGLIEFLIVLPGITLVVIVIYIALFGIKFTVTVKRVDRHF